MGSTPLRRFLQSLCTNSCWNYAVFWKLRQQNQMVLMWEDGYFGTLKVQDASKNIFTETRGYNGTFLGDAYELAMAYMSTINYALGDGVVGDVAYTGDCRWVFADSKSYGNFNTASNPEHADEWLFQFAAGVKTILLVPVIPLGVLQLGSLEDLPEDAQMANYIKDEFFTHQDLMEYADASFATSHLFSSQPPKTIDDFIWSNHTLLTKSLSTPTSDNWYSSHSSSAIEFPDPLHQSTDLINSEIPMNLQLVSDVGPSLNFPKECELHKALGPAFIADSSSSKTNETVFNITGFEQSGSLISNQLAVAPFTRVKNHNSSSSPSAITYEGVVEELTEEEGQQSNCDVLHQSKGSKASVASKRRVKSGAKQKARPRDRQLIQDRLKDLRELVPNGAKCSIDGLLDRTIKHMQFLESVSDRAVKLKQCVQSEKVGTVLKDNRTPVVKDSQSGASWAFELGGDLEVCPILVEDLQYPGHMVIEMICDDSMRFLEIAEVIHGLELTILHGVMEKRSGHTWAHYIVEAPKGFHRLDIFWPLMKLLQQPSPICSKI
ncbi:putative transcription factor bHLH family [Helianthus annuus]|uniref:Putative myc-type, basic helix-loop-helix (BHLH) domain, Transcription factor MYC/MYB N-terminal n=1 Tax=Helianthus annuus TaxID=4232 RepID=A0A251SSL0_HELAN|nr:transcription factor EMB1444 [Helianthus annuus]KAF5773751.1 putative transcription factor bHLH family [Helianthus annuus]KAJ0477205.1 putative transcription factor bHLH family [Helianthus annuus]KAJ0481603.1 putative transcription factor bHLH family [Helianthus annuus]KAJ0498039.1 putative transcription factor bHLH family [Helianthus annuus]KAJ0664038.1 putative transcription factor bHLH family [Helianthus annuus]